MSLLSNAFISFRKEWNQFFYGSCPPKICATLRIGFGLLIFLNFAVIFPDVQKWFGPEGLVTFEASRTIVDTDTITLFQLFPDSSFAVSFCYGLLLIQALCIALGFYGRFNAACVFILMTSFHHRNMALFDAEDNLLRLICFFLIWMPLDNWYSLRNLVFPQRAGKSKPSPIWALRLIQIQLTLVYISTAILKLRGEDWLNGSAIYYSSQIEMYERFPLPSVLINNLMLSKIATWSVLFVELALPFGLWIKKYRVFAIVAGILLHLSIEYSMNLYLFQWTMIVALLSFLPAKSPPLVTSS